MKVIYTDLDGTLLDEDTYSFRWAKKGLHLVKKRDIPWIICTSKTRSEIEYWKKKLDNCHPFISENGGGIFIPKKYFNFDIPNSHQNQGYDIIELGVKASRLKDIFFTLKEKYDIKSFFDMDIQEIYRDSSISPRQVTLAKNREYDIPFKILDMKEKEAIIADINAEGLQVTLGGRYYHLMSNTNKGKAVTILAGLLKRKYKDFVTIGIGNSGNDFSMLDSVDRPYLVRRKDGTYASDIYNMVKGVGPKGWTEVIEKEIGFDI